MAARDWAFLLMLSALWGASYPLIKVALEGHVGPFEIVLLRLVIATVVLYLVARLQGSELPRTARTWRSFAIMGLVGTAAPFFFISWGETRIDASLAAILSATVPFFTVFLAHVWIPDERLTVRSIAGIVIGFLGVVVLVGDVRLGGASSALPGVISLLLSSLCYGIANIVARNALREVPPVVASTGQMLMGAVFVAIPGGISTLTSTQAPTPQGLLAVAGVALLGTVAAYLIYYRLIARVGSSRTSTVAYLLPAFAVLYGTFLLKEALTLRLLIGFALILLGVAVVNGNLRRVRALSAAAGARLAR
ncbi:MAG TPA: DMT family transporter [Chloroflexota bacterium]|nr:DMT family transporter [Chloroflexota bacterium]